MVLVYSAYGNLDKYYYEGEWTEEGMKNFVWDKYSTTPVDWYSFSEKFSYTMIGDF